MESKLQIEEEVIHVIGQQCYDVSRLLRQLTSIKNIEHQLLSLLTCDETTVIALAEIVKRKEK